jgi:predicted MFS family arabinose efflux permease
VVQLRATDKPETEDEPPRNPPPLWRNRDYAGWWVSSLVSSLGSAMSQLAYPLLMLYATNSVARAGIVGACLNIGGLSTGLLGGALADRYSRRALVVTADLVQAVAVGTVVFAVANGFVNVGHIAAVALIQGMCNGISGAAMTPTLKRIVHESQFPALAASKQGRDMIARLAGPPLGGALFSAARYLPFLGDTISFVVSAIGVAAIRRPLGPDAADREAHSSSLAALREGIAYIRTNTYLRFVVVWVPLLSAAFGGMVLLTIALIKLRGGGPTTVGVVTTIAAVGGLGGALAAPFLARLFKTRTLVIIMAWLVVLVAVGLAAAPRPWEIGLVGALAVFLVVPLNVMLESYQLRVVPDAMLGRVAAALSFSSSALLWTAPLATGVLADNFGTPTAMLVVAGFLAVLAVWCTLAKAPHEMDVQTPIQLVTGPKPDAQPPGSSTERP